MRLRIRHEIAFRYDTPAARAIEVLRLTPRGHDGQFVVAWRIDVSADCRLEASTDPFGNAVHSFTAEGPLDTLVVVAEGEVETQDTNGLVRGQPERMPALVFLRETALTASDPAIRSLAAAAARDAPDRIATLHRIMSSVHDAVRVAGAAAVPAITAAETIAAGEGSPADLAHVFIAAARFLRIPARLAGGYRYRADRPSNDQAGHCWAEALVPDLGWVGFDPADCLSPTESYVRVAVGLDALGAAPVRGTHYGGGGEQREERVAIQRSGHGGRDFSIATRAPSVEISGRVRGGLPVMTYCVGIIVREGLVMVADTRTNAGLDNIAVFRKLHLFEQSGERVMGLAASGNLAVSQSVLNLLIEGFNHPDTGERETLLGAPTMFAAAQIVGRAIREVRRTDHLSEQQAQSGAFDVTFLLGGQVKGGRLRLFMVYAAGNFIEATVDTPYLQVGEHKYGKPILDRSITGETEVYDALKLGLISMDSTIRSNLTVGLPIDILVIRRDTFRSDLFYRIEASEPYFHDLRERWSSALRAAHQSIPTPPYRPVEAPP